MSWFIDNATIWFLLIGMIALGFGAAWWLGRKREHLIGLIVAIGLIALLWFLARVVVTDRKQLELNVRAMANAVIEGKRDVLQQNLANDFELQGIKRQDLVPAAMRNAKDYQVTDIVISSFDVEELKDTTAKVYFRGTVHSKTEGRPFLLGCRGFFVKENDQWKLKEIRFYNPLVNQNQPITLPIR